MATNGGKRARSEEEEVGTSVEQTDEDNGSVVKRQRTNRVMGKIHLQCLPHTDLIPEYAWCAYTQKAIRFVEMMRSEGFTVITYSGDKYSSMIHRPPEAQNPNISWQVSDPIWRQTYEKTLPDLKQNFMPGDIFACIVSTQVPLAQIAGFVNIIELGIGYSDVAAPFACFESASWQASVYRHSLRDVTCGHVRRLDTVIPNSYRIHEYEMASISERRSVQGGHYALFLARKIDVKGLQIAMAAVVEANKILQSFGVAALKLKMAGGGNVPNTFVDYMKRNNYSMTEQTQTIVSSFVEEYPVVSGELKKNLLKVELAPQMNE